MRLLIISTLLLCVACAPRGEMGFAERAPGATVHDIWVANFRPTDPPEAGQQSPPRPDKITFEAFAISVPQDRDPGEIIWPKGTPDARTDFVTVDQRSFANGASFTHALAREAAPHGEVMVFVHGFNVNHAEAVYMMAQVRHDFEVPVPTVLFSWPSAGVPVGYLYDRDSALIARDQFETFLVSLAHQQNVVLVGHSMGNLLIMETLRQIELSGSLDIRTRINALFMISPDIDGELFQSQAGRLSALPQPTVILATTEDIALRASARLTGRSNRLGSTTDRDAVGDLPITVLDVSEFSDGRLNHNVALQSPGAIALLKRMREDRLPEFAR